jgi:hypothetical protein
MNERRMGSGRGGEERRKRRKKGRILEGREEYSIRYNIIVYV